MDYEDLWVKATTVAFLSVAIVVNAILAYCIFIGAIPLEFVGALTVFLVLLDIELTLSMWRYVAFVGKKSAAPLAILTGLLEAAPTFMAILTAALGELGQRFQWDREKKVEWYETKVKDWEARVRELKGEVVEKKKFQWPWSRKTCPICRNIIDRTAYKCICGTHYHGGCLKEMRHCVVCGREV